ncbi:MAG: calcium-binding protein, partial [Sphingomonadales bacterium]
NFVFGGSGDDRLELMQGDDVGLGGRGDDAVAGDAGQDIIVGGDGNDILMGGAGDDVITGDFGSDDIYGGAGNDIVAGGRGHDTVVGGAGDDFFRYSRGDGIDTIFDDYTDTWEIVWASVGGWAGGFALNETTNMITRGTDVLFDGINWIGRFDFSYEDQVLKRHVPQSGGPLARDAGEDTLEFGLGINIQDIMLRQSGADLILGISSENAVVSNFAALPDQILLQDWYAIAPQIEQFVFAATGALDTETTKLGATTGVASDGDDTLAGSGGADWITGNAGHDVITGGTGHDILNGNAGRDELYGESGDDVLYGGAGDDLLHGGAGADIHVGGDGSDTVSYASDVGYSYKERVYLSAPEFNVGRWSEGDTFFGVENLTGTRNHDRLAGNDGDNLLIGDGGDDTLFGGLGDDVYYKDHSDKQDNVYDGAFTIEEAVDAAGNLKAGYTADWTLTGTEIISGVLHYVFRLTVTDSQSEVVYDYGSYKYTDIGQSMPAVSSWNTSGWEGGFKRSGNDQQVTREVIDDSIDGGYDVIEYGEGISLSNLYGNYTSDGMLRIAMSNNNAFLRNQTTPNLRIEAIQFHDGLSASLLHFKSTYYGQTVNGSDVEDDIILGNSGNAVLRGYGGNDVMSGGGGDDTLYGGDGDDHLEGGTGGDILDGGAGSDTVRYVTSSAGLTINLTTQTASGGAATGDTLISIENVVASNDWDDTITGSDGDNLLSGLGGNDTIHGEAGDDVLVGGAGDDLIYGGAGEDSIAGGEGHDQLWGGNDADLVDGGIGDDELYGQDGNDSLIGGDGDDLLDGGAGDDIMVAGTGNDTLYGGEGDDRLVGGTG